MPGRPSSLEEERMDQTLIDAVLSMWVDSDDELSFTVLHKGLVRKGFVQKEEYRYKTDRILRKLCRMKLMEKLGKGRYRLNVIPDDFKLFDYLQQIRPSSKSYVGGSLWRLAELYFLGMPEAIWNYEDAKYALEIINVRMAYLFEALRILGEAVTKREKESAKGNILPLPNFVIRELLLELIPYYLGSRAGIDFDGLPIDELNMLIPKMLKTLPEEATTQSPTLKKVMIEYFDILQKMARAQDQEADMENEKRFIEKMEEKHRDFALIVIRPEFQIDESGFEKRWVKTDLREFAQENKSALYIASSWLNIEKENVLEILDIHGRRYLGRQKWKETRGLYDKLYSSDSVARIIDSFEYYGHREKAHARKYIQKLVNDYGIKTIIYYLPFSHCRMNFVIPTMHKEEILQKFFPQVPMTTIHDWLNEGAVMANQIANEKMEDIKKTFSNLKSSYLP